MIHEEKHLPSTLKNDENFSVKELAKTLCTCHHKCNDTKDCIVEDEALLLINDNKSNNFDVKSNNEIEEMARFMCSNYAGEGNCADGNKCDFDCWSYREAEHLYNAGYRKQSEGEWIDRYNGKYANAIYECSICKEKTLWKVGINELGSPKITQALSPFCPNCGAKMNGG